MKTYIICVVKGSKKVINAINYIFYKGITKCDFTDFILNNYDVPLSLRNRAISYNDIKKEYFRDLFSLDKNVSDDDWYDIINHSIIKEENITLNNKKIYSDEICDLNDIKNKIILSGDNCIIKVSQLQKLYERNINELYNNLFLFNFIKKANDIAIANNICIITDIENNSDLIKIKKYSTSIVHIINCTNNEIKGSFYINNNVGDFNLFYQLITVIKYMLL